MTQAVVTAPNLIRMREAGQKIVMLTAYDFTFARHLDAAGVDILLVGDSLGNVIQGKDTTLPVTLDEIAYHTKAVVRAAKRAMVVADMPFLSYQVSIREAIANAGRLVKEASAHGVKLEGGQEIAETVKRIVDIGVPVMGHVGLQPQSVRALGGYRVVGSRAEERERVLADAIALERAGAFAIVLEAIPADLAEEITAQVSIPTIGIGAGKECDGQVLVLHDMLGLTVRDNGPVPKFVKQYAKLDEIVADAVQEFLKEVRGELFPTPTYSYQASRKVQ